MIIGMNGGKLLIGGAVSKLITVHGIRTDGRESVDLLGEGLGYRGFDVIDYDYKNVNLGHVLFNIRAGSKRNLQYDRARGLTHLAEIHDKPDIVAHSFGCLVTLRAMELNASFGKVFWYRPAMDRDFVIPAWGCDELYIIHHPRDKAIKLGSMLSNHDFGKMGTLGSVYAPPEGKDTRITNYRSDFEGHSGDFREGLSDTADFVAEKLR